MSQATEGEEVHSVSEFVEKFVLMKSKQEWVGEFSDFLFRGQPSSCDLVPRLLRSFPDDTPKDDVHKFEQKILGEFRRRALPYVEFKPDDDWDWLAIAQHHGLPTRLLDWTYSALGALWFAVTHSMAREGKLLDGTVWIARAAEEDDFANLECSPFKMDGPRIFVPRNIAKRITAQSGLFTVHPLIWDPVEEEDGPLGKLSYGLACVNIPASSFGAIRRELQMCGVNHATLFPDLDGLSKSLVFHHGLGGESPRTEAKS